MYDVISVNRLEWSMVRQRIDGVHNAANAYNLFFFQVLEPQPLTYKVSDNTLFSYTEHDKNFLLQMAT